MENRYLRELEQKKVKFASFLLGLSLPRLIGRLFGNSVDERERIDELQDRIRVLENKHDSEIIKLEHKHRTEVERLQTKIDSLELERQRLVDRIFKFHGARPVYSEPKKPDGRRVVQPSDPAEQWKREDMQATISDYVERGMQNSEIVDYLESIAEETPEARAALDEIYKRMEQQGPPPEEELEA